MTRTTKRAKRLAGIASSLLLLTSLVATGPVASAVVSDDPSAAPRSSLAVAPPIFSDDFSTGDFSNWTAHSSRFTIDATSGSPTAPSVRAQVTNQSAWASRTFDTLRNNVCLSADVNLVSGRKVNLLGLRSTDNVALAWVKVNEIGNLLVRVADGDGITSRQPLGVGWHNVELCSLTNPRSDTQLWVDHRLIGSSGMNHLGQDIDRIVIGDSGSDTTFDVSFDHVVFDELPGETGPDVTPPTAPGKPIGTSVVPSSIQITWAASTDDQIPALRYAIYRDGELIIGATEDTTFIDPWVEPGSTHTYFVVASDVAGHESTSPVSDPITVSEAPPSFMDDFSSGGFANWTSVTRLTIDTASGSPEAPSARAQTNNQRAFAYRILDTPMMGACLSANVNLISGLGIDLFRLRTATDGPIVKVLVNANGYLRIRADLTGGTSASVLPLGTGWHNVELCGTIGPNNVWNVYSDGVWMDSQGMDTGTTPIGRIQIGDTAAKTFVVAFDDVVLDQSLGDSTSA